ncbi:bile acid:sodium symporter [Sphingobacterium sp. T2]|uniref:bile acid:sodium symporter n=1 Tax=Sphingobacterium sp. T2 TaxID=1590596 RepID=UPI0018CE25D0|nr:bile acid:sodium symporter [Sphingobacterium sp. T2]
MIIDRFILFLFLSIVAAYFFPQLALHGDGNTLEAISTVGVSFIFFFYGLKLSLTDIKNGLRNWRLHLVVQCITIRFVSRLCCLLLRPLVGRGID